MRIMSKCLFVTVVVSYTLLFVYQEQNLPSKDMVLENALPVTFYKIAAGYSSQLAAEMLFIKTSVFLGGVGTQLLEKHSESLAHNFKVMTTLYPHFIDPYYFAQAYLTLISEESALAANDILSIGIEALPENFVLRFYYCTNYLLYLNNPLEGAKAFAETAKLPGAYPIFGHLSVILSVQGGDLAAGLIVIRSLIASESDEGVRRRYLEEASIFEQALKVDQAIAAYQEKYSAAPGSLKDIIPEFIEKLPDTSPLFVLVYDPPALRLERPSRK